MKKVLLTILSAALSVFTLAAASTASFDIEAYKLKEENEFQVVIESIVDLKPVEDNSEMDVSSILYNLLGQTTTVIADFAEHTVFSYRIWGKEESGTNNTYTIRISISPFYLYTDDVKDENNVIRAYYNIGNTSYVFPDLNNNVSEDGAKIEQSGSLSNPKPSENPTNNMSASWTVKQGSSSHRWIAYGAVAVNISTPDYKKAPNGTYKAECTVKLESNI